MAALGPTPRNKPSVIRITLICHEIDVLRNESNWMKAGYLWRQNSNAYKLIIEILRKLKLKYENKDKPKIRSSSCKTPSDEYKISDDCAKK